MVGLYIYVVCLFHLPLNNLPVFFVGSLPVEGSVDAQSDYGCVSWKFVAYCFVHPVFFTVYA